MPSHSDSTVPVAPRVALAASEGAIETRRASIDEDAQRTVMK